MLAATITQEQAVRTRWDAIVVGAGPAGSSAGLQLARLGRRTLIVERKSFPRDKVCGACMNGRAIATLRMLGLERKVSQLGAIPLERFEVRCGAKRGEVPLPAGVALSRTAFDALLVREAIAAGAEFLPQTSATLIEETPASPQRAVQLVRQNQSACHASAGVILLADGLGNPSLPSQHPLHAHVKPHSRIGLGGTVSSCSPTFESGTIYMAVGTGGYVGLTRVEAGRLNIAAALNPAMLSRDCPPSAAVTSILNRAGYSDIESNETIDWTGTAPLTRHCRAPAGHRVLLLGDAAGYVEPFTGEGIACALTSGVAAANLVAQNLAAWNGDVEQEWCRQHRELFDNRQRWCRSLARLLWHPWAVRGLLSGLAIAPWLARPIVRRINESPTLSV